MALILGLPDQAFDDNGVVMPAAELYMFDDASPATPKTTYTTAALSVAHAHPVVADASGFFPQMFAANGAAFYAVLTATGGDPGQPFRDWEDIQALGADDTTSFDQTFVDARLKVTSGEVDTGIDGILFQVGKDSPQNTGGYAKFQGWAGTQADQFWFDAADAEFTGNVAVLGDLAVTGTIPADKLLTSGVRTAQATTNIALDATYDEYVLDIGYLAPSTSLTVEVLLAFDVGGTMKVGVDDYAWSYWERGPTSGTSSGADASDDSMVVMAFAAAPTTPAGTPSTIQIRISSATGKESGVSGVGIIADDGTTYGQKRYEFVGMTRAKNYGKATFIQVKASIGTLSFTYALKGLAGF